MRSFTSSLATASAMFASAVSAQYTVCPVSQEFCMQVGVPEASASSGSGNVYFQMAALESYAWIGIGTGTRMSGSTMFIVYSDGDGNVTVSPRSASGHSQPSANSDLEVELLAGSGVEGGIMTANFLCSNCGNEIDFAGTDTDWISAYKQDDAIDSSSTSANIREHDSYKSFAIDMTQAQITSDANPFASSSSSNDTTSGSGSGTLGSGDSEGVASSREVNLILIHGVVMAVAFAFMYPVGSILMPLVGKWLVHAGWQMLAFMAMWAGFGIGYVKADDIGMGFKETHTVLGTIVCVAMIVQPVIGFLHHRYYKKHQARGAVSYAHIWYGRIIMFLGILNGGLGLELSNASKTFTIAYSIVAAIVGIAYVASSFVGEMRRSRRSKEVSSEPHAYKLQDRTEHSPSQSQFESQARQPQYNQYNQYNQYQRNNDSYR